MRIAFKLIVDATTQAFAHTSVLFNLREDLHTVDAVVSYYLSTRGTLILRNILNEVKEIASKLAIFSSLLTSYQ